MSIKIRINQIEFRNSCNTYPSVDKGEFLIWSPNERYGKIKEYLNKGYTNEGDHLRSPNGGYISLSLLESKELCIVIGWLKYDKKEGCCTLESVGPRLLDLTEEQREDFFEVYDIAEKKMDEANEWELFD
jgi:hypothetical protein